MSTLPTVPKPPRGYRLLATATAAQRKAAYPMLAGDIVISIKYPQDGWRQIDDGCPPETEMRSLFYDGSAYARRVPPKRSPSPRKKAGAK